MEEIIHAFGIDWRLIVIQMFNFAILAGALWYFLYTPVLAILNERSEKIKNGIEDALKAKTAREKAEVERGVVLTLAEDEARTIIQNAEKSAELKTISIEEAASNSAARILHDAEQQALAYAEKSKRDSEREIVSVAILAAEKILQEQNSK